MIIHLVLIRFNPSLTKQLIEDEIMTKFCALKNDISEIQSISWHYNLSHENHGFEYMAKLIFKNHDSLNKYLDNESHVFFCQNILFPNLEFSDDPMKSILVFDYEY